MSEVQSRALRAKSGTADRKREGGGSRARAVTAGCLRARLSVNHFSSRFPRPSAMDRPFDEYSLLGLTDLPSFGFYRDGARTESRPESSELIPRRDLAEGKRGGEGINCQETPSIVARTDSARAVAEFLVPFE